MSLGNIGMRTDSRKKPRRRMRYNATVLAGANDAPRRCLIRDVSQTGARLVLDGEGELPDHFVLLLTKDGAARRYCRVVWRSGSTIGVKFMSHA